ncbi:MAG: hypothetical protein LBK67_08540 [Coriobacteriales bacterium]|jgi:NRPS condensation-like uncharacterized protein|nr:hypothetical protein [Coriobacteriales bacterium]
MNRTAEEPAWANRRYKAEAFDLWAYYSMHHYKPFIRMQIDFDGRLDETILADAFEQSCVTLPLIACGFDTTSQAHPQWAPRKEAAREILQVVEISGRREDEISRVFTCPLDVSEGPQLRAFLVRDAQQDSLCLIINHMLCDGAGLKQYLTEVARLYSCIADGLTPSPAPFVCQRGTRAVLKGFSPKNWLRALFTRFEPSTKEIRAFHRNAGLAFESGPFSLLTKSLPAEDFKPIRAAAKTLGFTVNDLFMASLALAYHRVCKTDKILLSCAMDLRSFIPPDVKTGITNLAGRCPCVIPISPGDTVEDVMAKVVKPMKVYKQGLYAVSCIINWQIRLKTASPRRIRQTFQNNDLTFPLSATNTGIIDENCVRFGDVSVRSAYIAPPAVRPISLTVALSTFRDEMTVLACLESNDAANDFVRALFTTMKEELLAFGSRYQAIDDSETTHGI